MGVLINQQGSQYNLAGGYVVKNGLHYPLTKILHHKQGEDYLVWEKGSKVYNDFCRLYDCIEGMFSISLYFNINEVKVWSVAGRSTAVNAYPLRIHNASKSLSVYTRLGSTGVWLHAFNGTEGSNNNRLNGIGNRNYFVEYNRNESKITLKSEGKEDTIFSQNIISLDDYTISIGGYETTAKVGVCIVKELKFDEVILKPCMLTSSITSSNSADKKSHFRGELGVVDIVNNIFYPIKRGSAKVYDEDIL